VLLQFGNFQEDKDFEACMTDGAPEALRACEDLFDVVE